MFIGAKMATNPRSIRHSSRRCLERYRNRESRWLQLLHPKLGGMGPVTERATYTSKRECILLGSEGIEKPLNKRRQSVQTTARAATLKNASSAHE